MPWFSFTGTDPVLPAHYTLVTSEPSCPGTQHICAIQASNDGDGNPVITNTLKNEMIRTLNARLSSTNVKLIGNL